jgi:UrcA family protein
VHTADLDLDSQAGRQRLERRLAAAAIEVCGTASDFDLAGKNEVRRCRDETLAEARSRSDRIVAAAATGAPIAVSAAR